jgi:hypothetical protein
MPENQLLGVMDEDLCASLKDHLADLAIARERLVHYEAQCARHERQRLCDRICLSDGAQHHKEHL